MSAHTVPGVRLSWVSSEETQTPYLQVVNAVEYAFTDEQKQVIIRGMDATEKTVPHREGDNYNFIVLRRGAPIGLFAIFPRENNYAELGVRFWDGRSSVGRLLTAGLYLTFEHYQGALAVVYQNNRTVKRLLQAGGFKFLDYQREPMTGRTLEIHGVDREHFYRLMASKDRLREHKEETA